MPRNLLFRAAIVALLVGALSTNAAELRPAAARKLDSKLRGLLAQVSLQNVEPVFTQGLQKSAGENFVRVLIKTRGGVENLRELGVRVIGVAGEIATAVIPVSRLAEAANLDEVVYIEASKTLQLNNEVAAVQTGSSEARQQFNLSGNGVIVGILDTGIDWRHDDFRKPNGDTRIKFILDFSDPGDTNGDGVLDGPGPFGGTLYTEAQINAALNGGGSVLQADRNGHGTHVAGSAAGNGRATGAGIPVGTYAGMAPEADLICVKSQTGDLGSIADLDIINAVDFIDSVAAVMAKPYVINLSLGGHEGPHDGSSLQEQALDSFVGPNKPGKAIVVAAGNEGAQNIHAGGTISGSAVTIDFSVPTFTANSGTQNDFILFEGWYAGGANLSFRLTSPTGANYGPVARGARFAQDTPNGAVIIDNASSGSNPLNGDNQVVIQVFDFSSRVPTAGAWRLTITGNSGRYDLWLYRSSMNAELTSNIDFSRLVAMPGTARNVITVGAWISKKKWTDLDGHQLTVTTPRALGEAAEFSSAGPTRDGRVKPEISAPGQMIASTLSADAPPGGPYSSWTGTTQFPNGFILRDNRHAIGSGTSFAAPIVAGGVALMLEQFPGLDAIQIRNALIASAEVDQFTGTVPNNKWGYGKIALVGAINFATAVETREDQQSIPRGPVLSQNYPNPFNPETVIAYSVPLQANAELAIFDVSGRKIRTLVSGEMPAGRYEIKWDGRNDLGQLVSAGVYFCKLQSGGFRMSRKLVLVK